MDDDDDDNNKSSSEGELPDLIDYSEDWQYGTGDGVEGNAQNPSGIADDEVSDTESDTEWDPANFDSNNFNDWVHIVDDVDDLALLEPEE
jgi:hypothetical protein